ncbi:PTS sugar transporter subunit IIC, partial [Clostridioides difficile]
MLVQATMLAIIAGVGILDGRIFGQSMLDRPIVTGMLVGLVLGDIKSGIMIGAQLEL